MGGCKKSQPLCKPLQNRGFFFFGCVVAALGPTLACTRCNALQRFFIPPHCRIKMRVCVHRSSVIKIMSQGYFRCVAHPIRLIPCDELRPLSDSRSGRFHAIAPNHSLRRTVMTLAIGNIGKQVDAAIIRPSNLQQFVFLDRLQRGADSF